MCTIKYSKTETREVLIRVDFRTQTWCFRAFYYREQVFQCCRTYSAGQYFFSSVTLCKNTFYGTIFLLNLR